VMWAMKGSKERILTLEAEMGFGAMEACCFAGCGSEYREDMNVATMAPNNVKLRSCRTPHDPISFGAAVVRLPSLAILANLKLQLEARGVVNFMNDYEPAVSYRDRKTSG
jgi:hypothetical protein